MNNMNKVVTLNTTNAGNIGELRGLLASARAQGLSVAIVKIPIRLFAIDSGYQTPIRTEREMNYLINNFDDRKLLPVTGVPHDEEGLIYLVDGYGRWKASQIVDAKKYECLQCMVILNAPEDKIERRRFEAEQYAYQNKNVAKMKPIMKHGALEILEDPAILAMDEMQKKYGFKFTEKQGQRGIGVLGSYTAVYKIATAHGKECLDYMFDVCRRSGMDRKINGYCAGLLKALKDAYRLYPESRKETADYLSSLLRKYDITGLKSNAITRYPLIDYRTAMSLYIEDLIVDNLNLSHKRHVEGKSVVEIKTA